MLLCYLSAHPSSSLALRPDGFIRPFRRSSENSMMGSSGDPRETQGKEVGMEMPLALSCWPRRPSAPFPPGSCGAWTVRLVVAASSSSVSVLGPEEAPRASSDGRFGWSAPPSSSCRLWGLSERCCPGQGSACSLFRCSKNRCVPGSRSSLLEGPRGGACFSAEGPLGWKTRELWLSACWSKGLRVACSRAAASPSVFCWTSSLSARSPAPG